MGEMGSVEKCRERLFEWNSVSVEEFCSDPSERCEIRDDGFVWTDVEVEHLLCVGIDEGDRRDHPVVVQHARSHALHVDAVEGRASRHIDDNRWRRCRW